MAPTAPTQSEQVSNPGASAVKRKKFATPPVKVACLACRASRTRCDGKAPCTNCANKDRECLYKPSKRGGPRQWKKRSAGQQYPTEQPRTESPTYQNEANFFDEVLPSMVNPGACLDQLDAPWDSGYVFDSIFSANSGSANRSDIIDQQSPDAHSDHVGPSLRAYGSDQDILNAYYVFIHPYFPILPPPVSFPVVDRPLPCCLDDLNEDRGDISGLAYEPWSPLSLAILTVLTLIPHPHDRDPSTPESVLFRRERAQSLAQSTLESIEVESELLDSSTSPSRALSSDAPANIRTPLHPKAPPELEGVLALLILSVYEYAQRGNIAKMRTRAGQALIAAMDLSLHSRGDEDDEFSEARRRAWWMTYTCICQGSIVSSTPPAIDAHDPKFTTNFPTTTSDYEAWPVFLQAQQAILTCTQFVIELDQAVRTGSNMPYIHERMQELESMVEPLINRADTWSLDFPCALPVDQKETVVGIALKGIARIKLNSARIKLHRYCAFSDVPVFTERHCDLKSVKGHSKESSKHDDAKGNSMCSCNNLFNAQTTPSTSSTASDSSSPPLSSSPASSVNSHNAGLSSRSLDHAHYKPPFSSHFSAKICLKSALNIAQAFENLPWPNPTGTPCLPPTSLSPTSNIEAPRTMPAFSCCAMQGSYTMLMLYRRTRAISGHDPTEHQNESLVMSLLGQLRHGLNLIIGALQNYSIAFEALYGMRDQIAAAPCTVMT